MKSTVSRFVASYVSALLLCGLSCNSHAELFSITVFDNVGDPVQWNGHDSGDVTVGRVFFGYGLYTEWESAPDGPFYNNGGLYVLYGFQLLNLDNPDWPYIQGAGLSTGYISIPKRTLSTGWVSSLPSNQWRLGERVVVHRSYGLEGRGLPIPGSPDCPTCQYRGLFGPYIGADLRLGDEFNTPFSSFGVASRHPMQNRFGIKARDATGVMQDGILYFRSYAIGIDRTYATATGSLVEALDNRYGMATNAQFDDQMNLVLQTSAGVPEQTSDRGGLIAVVGFPLQTYSGPGGVFSDFFAQPRDLTDARIRIKLADLLDSGVMEARLVARDTAGSMVATLPVELPVEEIDWRMRFSDFTELVLGANFNVIEVVDVWLEVLARSPTPEVVPATEVLVNRFEIEVRQPKVLLTVNHPVLRYGETTEIRWQSAEALSCTGSGLLGPNIPLNGSITVSEPGVASITCTSANSETVPATDTITIRRATRSVQFEDPIGDVDEGADISSLRLDISDDGWFQVTASTTEDAPFPHGIASMLVRFYNGDSDIYNVEHAVLFGENGPPANSFYLLADMPEPTTEIVLSGRDPKLLNWVDGDRVALDTSVFGNPNPGDQDRYSSINVTSLGTPVFGESFPIGSVSVLHEMRRFDDVPADHWAQDFIETLAGSGITAGCGNGDYCPNDPVSRAQMAVFLERGMNGSGYSPPAATGNVFLDVAGNDFAASFIEQLFADGITGGCGGGNYCPNDEVTRDQMAVFLLRAKYGSGYSPPAATGTFGDVPLTYWAAAWIEQLAAEGITAGCENGNYCPEAPVTRDQMAVFLVRTFDL